MKKNDYYTTIGENEETVSEGWSGEEELSYVEPEEREGEAEPKEIVWKEKDPYKAYLEEVGQYRLFTQSEESSLLRQIHEGRKRIHSALRKLPRRVWNQVRIKRRGGFHESTLVREHEEQLVRWIKTHRVVGLSPKRFKAILKEVKSGEAMIQKAKGKLTQSNLRLVISIANGYRGVGLPFLDLIQEGNLGLMRAIEHFDPGKGYKLSTYATYWIRQAIIRAIGDKSRVVRLPIHVAEKHRHLTRLARTLAQEKGRKPTHEEIATHASLPPTKLSALFEAAQDTISLQAPVGEEGTELGDFLSDPQQISPAEQAERKEEKEKISNALGVLTPREEKVIRLRFGISQDREHTLEEVGQQLSVTRERVRQIERDALRKLRSRRIRRSLEVLVA